MEDPDSIVSSPAPAAPDQTEFHFWPTFARHWRESVRYFGFWRTLRQLAASLWSATLELLPSRRKARFGDMDFDLEHEVDTTRSNVRFRAQLMAELTGRPYFATEPWLFEEMMTALPIRFQDFTFVDLGSGKGRALLMAAPYGFKKITGVEYVSEWHRTAQENIRKYLESCAAENKPAAAIESICMDARDFEFPDGPLVVYLFNPFPKPAFATVLKRLRQSALDHPRPIFLAYRYPEFDHLLQTCGWLKRAAGSEQWTMYEDVRPQETGQANPESRAAL